MFDHRKKNSFIHFFFADSTGCGVKVGNFEQPWGEVMLDQWKGKYGVQIQGVILGMRSANDRRRYIVTSPRIGGAHTRMISGIPTLSMLNSCMHMMTSWRGTFVALLALCEENLPHWCR